MNEEVKKFEPWTYLVNQEKRTVVYGVLAHGRYFVGKASCSGTDVFDVEKGKTIAHMRAVLEQRKYDLYLTREFIQTMKNSQDEMYYSEGAASPHYMRAIQAATEEEKAQLAHIRDLKRRIKEELNN